MVAEVPDGARLQGVLGAKGVDDRRDDRLAFDRVDLAITKVEGGGVGAVDGDAEIEGARPAGPGLEPAAAAEGGAVADVPGPVVFENAEGVPEVVAVRLGEDRHIDVEGHPVNHMLLAREAALGLPA